MPTQTKPQSMETRLAVLEDKVLIKFEYIEKSFDDFNKKMDQIDNKQDEINKGIQDQQLISQRHYFDCPNTKKIEEIEIVVNDKLDKFESKIDIRLDKIEKTVDKVNIVLNNPKVVIGTIVVIVLIALFWINMEVNYKMSQTIDPIAKGLYFLRNPNEKSTYRDDDYKDLLNNKDSINLKK